MIKKFLAIVFFVFYTSTIVCSTGVLDTTFGTGGIVTADVGSYTTDLAYDVAIQPDGKVVVVGSSGNDFSLIRYNIDGAVDTTFGVSGRVITNISGADIAHAVAIQRDGKILVGGESGSDLFVLVRYNSDGSLDTSFGTGGIATYLFGVSSASLSAITIQNDDKILLAGTVDDDFVAVFRVNGTDGSLDTTFNSGGTAGDAPNTAGLLTTDLLNAVTIHGIVIQSDNKIVLAGTSDSKVLVLRYLVNGSGLDTVSFNNGGTPGYNLVNINGMTTAYGVGLQEDDKIIVAGYSYDGSTESLAVARFTGTGLLDSYANNNTSPFGTGGAGSQTGYIFHGFATFTSTVARGLVVQSDDKIVVAGTYDDDFIIARFLADGSALDTTFNTVGYTVTDIGSSSTDEAFAIAMQENNKFVVVGDINSNAGDFAVVRYNGDTAPQGAIDTTYDSDGFVTYPTDNDATHKPQVKALQVQADNSVLVVTENLAVATKSQLVQLASTGTVLTTTIDIAQTGVSDVIMDGSGRVLVAGSNGSNGWIARYTITQGAPGTFSLDQDFNSGAILVEITNSTQILKVTENSFGKIIVAAKNGSALLLLSYNSDGSVDTSFGVGGTGYYEVRPSANFYDMVIDANNYIYVAYNGSTNYEVRKVLADGTALDTGYGTSGVLESGLPTASYNAPRITLYNTDKLCIGSSQGSNDGIYIQGFAADGVTQDGYFAPNASTHLLSGVVITQIQADTNGMILFTGYDDNYVFVGQADIEGVSDFNETFAPNAQVPGLVKVMYNNNNPTDFENGASGTTPHRVSNAVSIGGNGNIIFGGYESIDASNTVSFVARVVGDTTPYTQVARYPGFDWGQVDVAFGTSGILSLVDAAGVDSGLGAPVAMHVYESGDDIGKMLILIANGSDTTVMKLNANYTADTTFGSGTGAIVLSGLANPTALQVDFEGKILVSAGTTGSGSGQLQRVLADGSAVDLTFTSPLDNAYVARIQSLTRIILVGEKNGDGCLVGINSVDGTVDLTFGTNGYYTQAATTAFADAFVDSNNNIIVAYKNGSDEAIVDRILPEGSGLDTAFGFGTVISSVSSAVDIRLAVDKDDKIIVVARNSDGDFVTSRYAANGADDVGPVTITLSASSVLEKIITLHNGSTLILGYNSVPESIVVYLNSSFVQKDIVTQVIGNISQCNAIDVISDPVIIVAGYDSVTTGVALIQLLHDGTATKISQNQSTLGVSGSVDATLGTTGISFFAQTGSDGASLQVARAIALQGNNRYVVALDGRDPDDSPASRIFLSVFNTDGDLDTDFSTDGQVELPTQYDHQYVKDMVVFATTGGVYKAIIAGYVASATLSVDSSLLMQFNLTTAALDSSFGGLYSDAAGTVSGHAAQIHTVARQSSGRIVTGGVQADGSGVLLGYSSLGRLDKSFGVDGYYVQPATGVYTQVVDGTDNIVIAYDNGSGQVIVARVLADGSGLDSTFNSGGTPGYIATGITGVTAVDQIRLAIDASGKILIVSVNNSGADFVIQRYESDGSASVSQTIAGATDLGTAVTALTLGQLLVDEDGKAIILGSAVDAGGTWMIVVRTTAGITTLDSTFNSTGYIKYQVDGDNTSRQLLDALIHSEGRVVVVGSEVVDIA